MYLNRLALDYRKYSVFHNDRFGYLDLAMQSRFCGLNDLQVCDI